MKRRIIRTFFIALLLLSAGGWVLSGFYWLNASYTTTLYPKGHRFPGHYLRGVAIGFGDIWICKIRSGDTSDIYGLQYDAERIRPSQFWPPKNMAGEVFDVHFGFAFTQQNEPDNEYEKWLFGVPFWLLTTISAFLLCLVWRKTRPKINPAKAFPVEAKTP